MNILLLFYFYVYNFIIINVSLLRTTVCIALEAK